MVMKSRIFSGFFAIAMAVFLASCNNTTADNSNGGGQTITIDSFSFTPTELDATAGETIHVTNNDSTAHTVTSESALNAFDDTSDSGTGFDTGTLNAGGEGDITIPEAAAVGDQLFFYCELHKGTMTTPNGTITIVAP